MDPPLAELLVGLIFESARSAFGLAERPARTSIGPFRSNRDAMRCNDVGLSHCQIRYSILLNFVFNNSNNNNNQDNVYGAIIIAEPLREFARFIDECRMAPSGRRPKTKPDDLGCESTCTGCQKLHVPPSPLTFFNLPRPATATATTATA